MNWQRLYRLFDILTDLSTNCRRDVILNNETGMTSIHSKVSLDEDMVVPLIATAFLIATSFFPIFQVILLELFRLYTPVAEMLGMHYMSFFVVANSSISLALLYQFFRSRSIVGTSINVGLAVLFLYPMLIYPFRSVGGEDLYMLTLILAAFLFGIITGAVAVAKQLYNYKEQNS